MLSFVKKSVEGVSKMKRREAREKAFQFLFQIDINNNEPVAAIREFLVEQGEDDFLQTLI